MIDQTAAERLAAAINQLRPDWPTRSLTTFIQKNLADRAHRDIAVALTWVACDSESQTPARVLEAGPWWKATQAQAGTVSAITHRCPEHPARTAWGCPECDTTCTPTPDGFREEVMSRIAHRTRLRPAQPKPQAPEDLSSARTRADQEATA